jgi:hypothetical protein
MFYARTIFPFVIRHISNPQLNFDAGVKVLHEQHNH